LAVRIRLSRVGATKRPSYRVVAIDSRRPRDGRALEILGFYDPLTKPATVQIDAERLAAWVGKGALPSDTVAKLIKINGSAPSPRPPAGEVAVSPAPKPKRSRKATAKATAATEPAAAKAASPEAEAASPEAEAASPEAEAASPEPAAAVADADAEAEAAPIAEATE
jgi:small subunit ribosomal protein S16